MVRSEQLVTALVRFATTFAFGASARDVLEHVATQIEELLPVTGLGLLLVDDHRCHHLVASSDPRVRCLEGLALELGEGPCLTAHGTGLHVAIPDLAEDRATPTYARAALGAGVGATYAFPLRHAGVRTGALELYASRPVLLSRADLTAAQQLADVVGAYVTSARGREAAIEEAARLSREALHDPLTGLPNRRLLRDRLGQAEKRAHRSGHPFGIIFGDVDGFKAINDRHGHAVGDELLIALAERLGAGVRPGDTLARVSGDEFVMVCEDVTDLAGLEEVAARTTAALGRPFRLADGRPFDVRMSVGTALAGPGYGSAADALAAADAQMYLAKHRGRTPVILTVPEPVATSFLRRPTG